MERNKIRLVLDITFVLLNIFVSYSDCEDCQGTLNGNFVSESCSVGGCCIPSDGSGDTLCCIPTLTLILVSVFIGGTILTIVCVIVCCLLCRYRKKRKQRQRLEERRRRQRERDAERQRRLMMDPFANGDPFRVPVEGETAQPPHYHGQQSDSSSHHPLPVTNPSTQRTHIVQNPPPYPNTPPPAYYSRIGTRQGSRARSRNSHSRIASRTETRTTNSRIQSSSEYTTNDVIPEVTYDNSPIPDTPDLPNRIPTNVSRINSNISAAVIRMNSANNRRPSGNENERNIITIEDLEANHKDNDLENCEERRTDSSQEKAESRLSTNIANVNNNDVRTSVIPESRATYKVNSRMSSKIDSRASSKIEDKPSSTIYSKPPSRNESKNSTRIMNSIFNTETPSLTNVTRGRFIKSNISTVSEDPLREEASTRSSSHGRHYIRSIQPEETFVKQLDFV